jgi:hypothetical protein
MATPPKAPVHIDTRSAHEVKAWMEERKRDGTLKRCANLYIQYVDWMEAPDVLDRKVFLPDCLKHSFHWKVQGMTDAHQKSYLEHQLGQNPISCPADCNYYQRAWVQQLRSRCKRVFTPLAVPFMWFSKAVWQTQVALIVAIALIIILWRFPQWLPPLIELVKAVRGH